MAAKNHQTLNHEYCAPTKIMTISGSLRAASSNSAALEALRLLAPADVTVLPYGGLVSGLASLPHFNPDLDRDEDSPPQAVRALRQQIGACQGLVICSPEYAHGVAGAMKNALDWLVASVEFPGMPVALINVSPRATFSEAQLRETLTTMSARVIEEASITLPLAGRGLDAHGIAGDPQLAEQLRAALANFVRSIAAP
jgi:chromate reductase